jgi:hypothetical protein
MKRMLGLFLAALPIVLSCGIDEYAYLEPVATVTIIDPLKVNVKLPSNADQTDYFDESLIYYKIYTTDVAASPNPYIATNKKTITNANENNPTTLEAVLKGLNFKELSFGNDTDADFSSVENPLSKSADSGINGQLLTIDFNLNDLGRNYPVLKKSDGSIYKMLRNADLGFPANSAYQNLTYHDTFETDKDQDFIAGGAGYAHAMLFIVASGHDNYGSQLHSTATEVGVFLLADRD